METLKQAGEREIIRRLARRLSGRDDVLVGIGDDCALTRVEGSLYEWLLTTDPVIEGIHFLPDAPAEAVGHKAVGRVLSDIAACGGEPLWVLIDVVAPADLPLERLERAYDGAQRLCSGYGAAIIGGDVARGERMELHVFGVGRVPRGRAVLRSGARPGDVICVTGELGGSLLGRHLAFEPRVREGRWLAEGGWATAMMDLSDGLAADLRRLFEQSGVGARLWADRIPVSEAARERARDTGWTPLHHALCDGEDFELLFTIPAARQAEFEARWRDTFPLRCSPIGEILSTPGRFEMVEPGGAVVIWASDGYEHFRE